MRITLFLMELIKWFLTESWNFVSDPCNTFWIVIRFGLIYILYLPFILLIALICVPFMAIFEFLILLANGFIIKVKR